MNLLHMTQSTWMTTFWPWVPVPWWITPNGQCRACMHNIHHVIHPAPITDIRTIYEQEVLAIIRPGSYCGIWQVHAMASVMGTPFHSLYPGLGSPKRDLSRPILPRQQMCNDPVYVLRTHTTNSDVQMWWEPNHFVAAFKTRPAPVDTAPQVIWSSYTYQGGSAHLSALVLLPGLAITWHQN